MSLPGRIISYPLSYIVPQTVERRQSDVNGQIVVERYRGALRISVGGYWQSGAYPTGIMSRCIAPWGMAPDRVRDVLLLGVGGGSAVEVVRRRYPAAAITGIELDPVMVDVAKSYSPVMGGAACTVIVGDAHRYVRAYPSPSSFDAILNDVYIAGTTPAWFGEEEFLHAVRRLLRPGGLYACNASYRPGCREATDVLIASVRGIFPSVSCLLKPPHMIIRAVAEG